VVFKVRKGLDLPIAGRPRQELSDAPPPRRVGLLGHDYLGLKPRMRASAGERVRLGQPIFEDRGRPGVLFTAPASGVVEAVHRGPKRRFESLVIEIDPGSDEAVDFEAFGPNADRDRDSVRALLLESGLWTALRTRPFTRTPNPDGVPHSIFVTAMDSQPHAPLPELAVQGRESAFERGLTAVAKLTEGPVHLCVRPGSPIEAGASGARISHFDGPHPCGTVGYHIHRLDPVGPGKVVWHLGYQDVLRIGHLFATGRLDVTQVVSLAGPEVREPRVLRTRIGAELRALTESEHEEAELRVISGSVLRGERAMGEVFGFLGRFARQVSVIREGRERHFLGWTAPGPHRFSVLPTFVSSLLPKKRFRMNSSTQGSRRAMVPIGLYERVMPMDLMPTHLLRAISAGDIEWAEELGVLELDEEDLSLCTFVCPSKIDFGPALRRVLDALEKEQQA